MASARPMPDMASAAISGAKDLLRRAAMFQIPPPSRARMKRTLKESNMTTSTISLPLRVPMREPYCVYSQTMPNAASAPTTRSPIPMPVRPLRERLASSVSAAMAG